MQSRRTVTIAAVIGVAQVVCLLVVTDLLGVDLSAYANRSETIEAVGSEPDDEPDRAGEGWAALDMSGIDLVGGLDGETSTPDQPTALDSEPSVTDEDLGLALGELESASGDEPADQPGDVPDAGEDSASAVNPVEEIPATSTTTVPARVTSASSTPASSTPTTIAPTGAGAPSQATTPTTTQPDTRQRASTQPTSRRRTGSTKVDTDSSGSVSPSPSPTTTTAATAAGPDYSKKTTNRETITTAATTAPGGEVTTTTRWTASTVYDTTTTAERTTATRPTTRFDRTTTTAERTTATRPTTTVYDTTTTAERTTATRPTTRVDRTTTTAERTTATRPTTTADKTTTTSHKTTTTRKTTTTKKPTTTAAPTTAAPTSSDSSRNGGLESMRNTDPRFTQYRSVPSNQLSLSRLTEPAPVNDNGSVGDGQFRAACQYSHFAYDDPIIYPNQPGRSHLHMFFGNTETNAHTTTNSLVNSGGGTCNGFELNRSGYWTPALLDGRGNAVVPDRIILYYKSKSTDVVQRMPQGLKMVSGNTGSESFSVSNFLYWSCGGSGHSYNKSNRIPNCGGDTINATISFPQCWDGRNLDSADHRSHMALVSPHKPCPSTHPVRLPQISILMYFPGDKWSKDWHLSSDRSGGFNSGPGATLHADWWGGWNDDAMDLWTDGCMKAARNCSFGQTGTPRQLAKLNNFQNYPGNNYVPLP